MTRICSTGKRQTLIIIYLTDLPPLNSVLLSLFLLFPGGIRRDPNGQRDGLPHRDAQDPYQQVRRDVRRGLPGGQVHAVPPGPLRPADRTESEHAAGAAEQHDQLDRRQLRLLHQGQSATRVEQMKRGFSKYEFAQLCSVLLQ
jgi:hypothetical protein